MSWSLPGEPLPRLFWACLGAAVIVRLPGIDKGLRGDEMGHLLYSSAPLPEIVPRILANDAHPPLSYLLYHGWLLLGASDAWVRLPTVILGVLICALVYFVGRDRTTVETRLTAMWFVAIAPVSVLVSQTVRSYALAAACIAVAFLCMAEADRRQEGLRWPLAGYAVAATLALYSFYFSVLALAVFGAVACWRWRNDAHRLWWWVVTNGVIALLYLPWLPFMLRQMQRVRTEAPSIGGFYVGGLYVGSTVRGLTGLVGFDDALLLDRSMSLAWPRAWLLVTAVAVIAGVTVVAVIGLRALRTTSRRGFAQLIAAASLGPAVLALAVHQLSGLAMTPRYMFISFIMLTYVAAAAILSLRSRPVRVAALALCSVVLLARDVQLYAWTEVNWKHGAEYLAATSRPGDALLYIGDARAGRYMPRELPSIDLAAPATVKTLDLASFSRLWIAASDSSFLTRANDEAVRLVRASGFQAAEERSFGMLRILRYDRLPSRSRTER